MRTLSLLLGAFALLCIEVFSQEPLKIYPDKDTYRSHSRQDRSPVFIIGDNGGFTALLTFSLPNIAPEKVEKALFYFTPVQDDAVNRIRRADQLQFFGCDCDDWQPADINAYNFPALGKFIGSYTISPQNGYGYSHFIDITDYIQQEVTRDGQASIMFTKSNLEFTRFAASEWPERLRRPHLLIFTSQLTNVAELLQQPIGEVRLFPNPATDLVTLQIKDFKSSVLHKWQLLDNNGRPLSNAVITEPETLLDLSSLPQGQYVLHIIAGRQRITRQILKLSTP